MLRPVAVSGTRGAEARLFRARPIAGRLVRTGARAHVNRAVASGAAHEPPVIRLNELLLCVVCLSDRAASFDAEPRRAPRYAGAAAHGSRGPRIGR